MVECSYKIDEINQFNIFFELNEKKYLFGTSHFNYVELVLWWVLIIDSLHLSSNFDTKGFMLSHNIFQKEL